MMNRRQLLQHLSAAGLLSAGGVTGFLQRALANDKTPVPPGLQRLKGQVTINGDAARDGQLIRPGDTVATSGDGEAIYVIDQDAFLQRGGSTVSFGRSASDFMRLLNGRILSVFGKGDRNLRLATATIGIRGTACYLEEKVDADGTANARAPSYFCLCYGAVDLTPTAIPSQRESYTTTHHDRPLLIHDDPQMATCLAPASVMNHSDAELILLENLVGRWPPFYGQVGNPY